MTTSTRLMFGIRTSEAVSLTITAEGQLPPQPPALRIKTGEQDLEIQCSNNAWVVALGAGEHIAYMPAPGDRWFEGQLTFTLSAPVTIVSYKDATRAQLVSWIDNSGILKDSKNPWPPPREGNADLAPPAPSTWLGTLTTMAAEVPPERSGSMDVPPAGTGEPRRWR